MKKRWKIFWIVCGSMFLIGIICCSVSWGMGTTLTDIARQFPHGISWVSEDKTYGDPDDDDDDIDILREYIRDRSIELMALKQPMARDLREIYALADISAELERIGDYAENIASEVVSIAGEDYIKELIDIPKMAQYCLDMIEGIKSAFLNQDADLSYKVALMDKEIDILYYKVREDCLKVMHENPEKNITQGVKLVFTARYLERIGDHITNICEKIIYARNGKMIEIG